MSPSLRAFLSELIDYAGLFPPAALDLEPAIRNYASYRNGPDAWMLGRFIFPASRLTELDPFVSELIVDGPPLSISALGRGGASETEYLAHLERDLADIAKCHDQHPRRVVVEVFESKVPATFGNSFLAEVCKGIDGFGEPALTPYFEIPPGSAWAPAIAAIAHDRATYQRPRCHPPGCKLRCGGVEASAFPAPESVADAIAHAVHAGVPLKFTAGLHHPIRKFDASVQAKMYGFFNVFGAGILAAAYKLNADAIQPILENEDPTSFAFDEAGFRWHDLRVSAEQVAEARKAVAVSYGSCSFDEPRDDLRELGLLEG